MVNQYRAQVDLALKAPDAKNVEKTLDSILAAIDKLPSKGASASKAVQELVGQIKKIKSAIEETGSFNSVIRDVKILGASLKTIGTLQKGLQLFSNEDIARINKGQVAITQAAKAYDAVQRASQVKSGTFGMDASKVDQVAKSVRSLQTELKSVQQTIESTGGKVRPNDPLYQQGLQIQRNIKSLELLRTQIQRTNDLTAYNTGIINQGGVQKAQFQARQSGAILASDIRQIANRTPVGQTAAVNRANLGVASQERFANPDFVALQAAKQKLADLSAANRVAMDGLGISRQSIGLSAEARTIDIAIQARKKEITAELIRGNGETAKSVQLSKQLLDLEAKLKIQKSRDAGSNADLQQARDQNRIDAMVSRTQGAGGAALLKVQLALMANYAIINTVSSSITNAITTSIELEAALKNVQAVTATTGTEMIVLSDKVKTLASNSRFTAVEVANASLILGQAGLSAKQVAEALPAVITLATAAGTSLANAVDLVTSIVGVFDKTSNDTVDIANKITTASNNSKVSVDKLSLAFQYVGNAAAQTGVSFEETTAALATMSNAGITSGSTLGTGLRAFLTEVQKPSQQFLESLNRIGLGVTDIDIRAKGLLGVISTLREAGFVATDAIQSFDIRSASAFNGLIANPDMLKMQFDLLQNTQAAMKASEIQMDSFESQAKRLTTSFQVAVSNGLAPLQAVLKSLASVLADLFGWLGQNKGAMELLTTGAIAFIGLSLVSHFAGIITGLASMGGILGVLGTGMAALTTVTMGTAAANVGLSGSATVVSGALARAGAAAAGSAGAMGILAGVSTGLATTLSAVTAALAGMSLLTGIGLLIIGAAVTYTFLSSEATKAKDALDKVKAASNESKGAFDEKKATVDLLAKKIEELSYKEATLSQDQESLNRMTRELNSQFGNLGLQIDMNNNSFTTMIGKLRSLKGEMQQVANSRLDLQIQAQETLLGEQTKQLSNQVKGDAGYDGKRLNYFIQDNNILEKPGLTSGARENISQARVTLGKMQTPGFIQDPKNAEALSKLANAFDQIKSVTPENKRDSLNAISKTLLETVSRNADVMQTKAELAISRQTRSNIDRDTSFRAKPILNGKTFDQAMPGAIDLAGTALAENPSLKGKDLQLFQAAKALGESKLAQIKEAEKAVKDQKLPSDQEADLLTFTNQQAEKLRSQVKGIYKANEDVLKLRMGIAIKTLEADNRPAKAGPAGAEQRAKNADIDLRVGTMKADMRTAGDIGENSRAQDLARMELELGQANAQRTMAGRPARSNSGTKDPNSEALAESLRIRAATAERASKGNKISANQSTSIEEVDNLIDVGIQNLIKANSLRVEALMAEQKSKIPETGMTNTIREANAEALRSLKEDGEEKVRQFAESSGAIYKVVAKRSAKFGKADTDNAAQTLANLKNEADEALFTASRPLAQIATENAAGYGNPNSTRQKLAELAFTQTKVDGLEKQLNFYVDYIESLEIAAESSRARLVAAKAALDNASPEEKSAKQGLYEVALGTKSDRQRDLVSAKGGLRSTRNEMDSANVTAEGQRLSIPQEASWDNLNAKIKITMQNYSQSVNDFDSVGTIGEGIKNTLGGLSGQFSALFTNIVSGSMSAKDAFKSFAAGIIKAMLDIVAQQLAMMAIKQLLGAFGMASGGYVGNDKAVNSGAALTANGFTGAASGGEMMGGTPGKDSIPIMAMAGEFMLKKTAVDAIGVDNLYNMNQMTESSVRTSNGSTGRSNSNSQPEVTNIWLVPAGTEPSLGPKDVVMIIADTLNQGTSTVKTLVKQIASGQA